MSRIAQGPAVRHAPTDSARLSVMMSSDKAKSLFVSSSYILYETTSYSVNRKKAFYPFQINLSS